MVDQTGFPGIISEAVDGDSFQFTNTWYDILLRLWRRTGGSDGAIASEGITLSASPFSHETNFRGSVVVQGGTVSQIDIIRADDTIDTGQTAGMIPVMPGDTIKVTYSSAPTMTFLPSEITQ